MKGSYLEHLAGALAVGGGDERGVQVQEAVRLEEVVRGLGEGVADARDRCDGVGARPQVHHAPQELRGTQGQISISIRADIFQAGNRHGGFKASALQMHSQIPAVLVRGRSCIRHPLALRSASSVLQIGMATHSPVREH